MRKNFLLAKIDTLTKKNGEPFLRLTLKDRGGSYEAMLWDVNKGSSLRAGSVVTVLGEWNEYNGKQQVKIASIFPCDGDPTDYLPASPRDIGEMWDDLCHIAGSVTDADYRRVALKFTKLDVIADSFKKAPAASKHHHAYVGGLLEHTLAVVRIADAISLVYPDVDHSLVITGAILHDVGKAIDEFDPVTLEYTTKGNLLGHIFSGAEVVRHICMREEIPADKTMALVHCILSHHGKKEWGSPVVPMTPEALIVHMADNADSKIRSAVDALRDVDAGEWGAFVPSVEAKMMKVVGE